MNIFDVRTVILLYTLTNCVCMFVIIFLWKQNRKRFDGIGFWVIDYVMQFIGLSLISLRGILPDYFSILLGSPLIIAGSLFILIGLENFTIKRGYQFQNYILFALYFFLHIFFIYKIPSLLARNILFSTALLLLCFQCSLLLLYRVDREILRTTKGVGSVFLIFCLINITRIVFDIIINPGSDLLKSNIYDVALLIIYQLLFIILTFSLSLMLNHRLFNDIEKDIIKREEMEAALRISEEKFSKAFHASPDAIVISRITDGKIIDVNEGFCSLSGYSYEDALSSSSIDLSLWINTADREKIVELLKNQKMVLNVKIEFRGKSGNILNCLYSGGIITLGSELYILSVVHDVSESEQAEKILRLRLELWEYSLTHTVKELMQKSLDEIEKLTGSLIGFYHFVNEKENSLTLQSWSTRTKVEFCKAEGEDMHYAIDKAGVWTDCIRERRAVVHNDYSSLPHRKGLPKGHAEVKRELVVPIMHDNQIVSILGVGNKPDEYDESDIVLVTFIADLIWTIVTQKKADEEILKLNNRLEQMAMTDYLTGLANMRSFYNHAPEELRMARRYHMPLTLVMLDIDKFKNINDTFGHEAGDKVLQSFAKILNNSVRDVDYIVRLGGEEFAILMPNTNATDAVIFAERLRAAIENAEFPIRDKKIKITSSLGISDWSDQTDMKDVDILLKEADKSMYEAKSRGRNCVVYINQNTIHR
jgi:diguanylate cyclase (GGDEF)-like protein/PAS domain S-box-containing protein